MAAQRAGSRFNLQTISKVAWYLKAMKSCRDMKGQACIVTATSTFTQSQTDAGVNYFPSGYQFIQKYLFCSQMKVLLEMKKANSYILYQKESLHPPPPPPLQFFFWFVSYTLRDAVEIAFRKHTRIKRLDFVSGSKCNLHCVQKTAVGEGLGSGLHSGSVRTVSGCWAACGHKGPPPALQCDPVSTRDG